MYKCKNIQIYISQRKDNKFNITTKSKNKTCGQVFIQYLPILIMQISDHKIVREETLAMMDKCFKIS